MNNIPVLNGTNFKKLKEHIVIVLGCMDLDYLLRFDHPVDLNETSTNEQKFAYEKWERSNRMRLMMMQHSIPESLRGRITGNRDAKGFLKEIVDRFAANKKVETTQYVQEEDTLKQERIESAHLTSTSGTNVVSQKQKNSKIKETADKGTLEPKDQKPYFFCKKLGYMRKECSKYAAWREKKGLPKESSAN
ncbi:hypothetical protein KY290_025082 [Solanum tuberosum]|uniref:Gag-pol polyprotein n=1 Tax=Solanum tuberosum TaxID=4113 RepID=A0ABQ7USJ3_SOLTU|nr:hypothetical protein KY284_023935 [Solanum tuberosum]KAH0754812.1 hypothetical protein KY290_025082 [Solanum tuberosum]